MMWAIIVACCVQINCNALHAIDAILAPWDSLVDFRTERPELPDPPDAGLPRGEELRRVRHLRAWGLCAVDGANLRADAAPDALARARAHGRARARADSPARRPRRHRDHA